MVKRLLKLDRVCLSYSRGRPALEDVSFDVNEGDIIGIAGPNGAGKTTLLKLIVGLLKPTTGSIVKPPYSKGAAGQQRISYLPQNLQPVDVNFPATVREVVGMGLYSRIGILGRLTEKDRLAIEAAIRNVNLWKFRDAQVTSLSGGQLQRTLIARALVSEPALLIMDEPTAAVDLAGEEAFYMLVKHVNEVYGVAVILVSHDVYSLLEHTDRLIYINRKVLYDGAPKRLSGHRLIALLFSHKHSKALVRKLDAALKRHKG
jgi:zinc transport system ATP-binding protein